MVIFKCNNYKSVLKSLLKPLQVILGTFVKYWRGFFFLDKYKNKHFTNLQYFYSRINTILYGIHIMMQFFFNFWLLRLLLEKNCKGGLFSVILTCLFYIMTCDRRIKQNKCLHLIQINTSVYFLLAIVSVSIIFKKSHRQVLDNPALL